MQFLPLREIPFKNQVFKKGDVFVLFGELFDCGYVNGLLEEAKKYGIIFLVLQLVKDIPRSSTTGSF